MLRGMTATEREDGAAQLDRQREMASALGELLPPQSVLWRTEDTRPYECDGLMLHSQLPMIVVLPETEVEVAKVLRLCHARGVPVVPRGAGTGLSGGALPLGDGVLLSLAKLNRIIEVDPRARTATVQPGVRNLAISEAAAQYGLYYAPDPSSQIACTIGGNVAENSGGVHCLKYGLTVHNVLRVRGLTMEGESVDFGSRAPDAPGLDLLATIIGSEGMLAVTTEVTVRLVPRPRLARCIMASFADVGDAGDAVAALIAAGIIPAGLEMRMQATTLRLLRFCCARVMGRRRKSTKKSSECVACCTTHEPRASRYPTVKPSACVSGPAARTPFPQRDGPRPRTTAWMGPFRASDSAQCFGPYKRWKASTRCVVPMFFTPATATCIR
jgi:hypothetical protein